MPRIDFDQVPDNGGLLPEGQYLANIEDINEKTASTGSEMWGMKLVVDQGEHKGRQVWDNIVFTMKALPRVKMLCKAAGVPTNGAFDLQPRHLLGKRVLISVYHAEYQGQKQAKIPFDGYKSPEMAQISETVGAAMDPAAELPF